MDAVVETLGRQAVEVGLHDVNPSSSLILCAMSCLAACHGPQGTRHKSTGHSDYVGGQSFSYTATTCPKGRAAASGDDQCWGQNSSTG
ncbi:hypothetical protein MCOR25_003523 [Pyricularia grisea]|uniref:Uncharacterized protein n=1 Tax=Pyricularia grisea TaxID=148305 RepID=A0A6P8AY39_PYRGI|nr:hypothetical protein PgNI_10346 [Pyricularia grisea]KAI6373124.1 hypothetical protein MCOR25_003523 [Pyricularia grisea]TLD07201.1 hypothetical protein PgNI_10346 [Pyricularia grisea]